MVTVSTRTGSEGTKKSCRSSSIIRSIAVVAIAVFVISARFISTAPGAIASASSRSPNRFGPPDPKSPESESPRKKSDGRTEYERKSDGRYEKLEESAPVVVAHAVSLIKCSKGSSVEGFLDAAAVLRHSVHKNSVHYVPPTGSDDPPQRRSRYSYKMYGIVHTSCQEHARVLGKLGYEILVRDHPVKKEDIRGEWLRNHVEGENCCGSAEFIKLYAVHWDMDVAVLQPLDDLYDVMLYPSSHPLNVAARERVERQHPEEEWPETVDAFLTRDVTSAKPWEKVTAVQGGFLVARPDMAVFDAYIDFIKEGNYTGGRGDGSGWSGLGYGGFQGAMAYQGVVAFYYDQLRPNTAVELNVCRWNQVAADVIWRGPERMDEHHLQCRDHPRTFLPDGTPDHASNTRCEDCRNTPIDAVKSAHYTACKKPWECKIAHPRVPRDKRQSYRLENLVNVSYCMNLVREWFELRKEFELALEVASDAKVKPAPRTGAYEEQYFLGYCRGSGEYIPMKSPDDDFNITRVYGM